MTYALKLGRGESITSFDMENPMPELYLYLSLERGLSGPNGPDANGVKLYSWLQMGARSFETDGKERSFGRRRYGAGLWARGYLWGVRQRLNMELMLAEGMIFLAPTGNVKGGFLQYAAGIANKSRAVTLDYGIYIHKWQLNMRWHFHDLLYETDGKYWTCADHRQLNDFTVGVRYNFTPKVRLTCDYMVRDARAPDSHNYNIEKTLDGVGNRIAVQFTWIID
jgi:hypothetical protein